MANRKKTFRKNAKKHNKSKRRVTKRNTRKMRGGEGDYSECSGFDENPACFSVPLLPSEYGSFKKGQKYRILYQSENNKSVYYTYIKSEGYPLLNLVFEDENKKRHTYTADLNGSSPNRFDKGIDKGFKIFDLNETAKKAYGKAYGKANPSLFSKVSSAASTAASVAASAFPNPDNKRYLRPVPPP